MMDGLMDKKKVDHFICGITCHQHAHASYQVIRTIVFDWAGLLTRHRISFFRHPWKRLYQRQLHRWLQKAERLHRHPRSSAGDVWRILEDDLGAEERHHRHDDQTGGAIQGKREETILAENSLTPLLWCSFPPYRFILLICIQHVSLRPARDALIFILEKSHCILLPVDTLSLQRRTLLLFSHDWLVAYFISPALLKALDYNQW